MEKYDAIMQLHFHFQVCFIILIKSPMVFHNNVVYVLVKYEFLCWSVGQVRVCCIFPPLLIFFLLLLPQCELRKISCWACWDAEMRVAAGWLPQRCWFDFSGDHCCTQPVPFIIPLIILATWRSPYEFCQDADELSHPLGVNVYK